MRLPDQIRNYVTRSPYLVLTGLVLLTLGPVVFKPFNIDEPLFIWAAKHICSQPLNPYGFDVNWYQTVMPMWQVTKNPPLACYYLAVIGRMFGWSEVALHSAFLLPAIAVVLGTYRLGKRFCQWPMLVAITTLFAAGFLVSSTTVMCDTLMLAFWIWAVIFWVEGLSSGGRWRLFAAGGCMALAGLTKYFGVCVVPLLAAYSVADRRPFKVWVGYLLIPLAALLAYQAATHALYGAGLFADAGRYATSARGDVGYSKLATGVIALAFTGGCLGALTLLAPLLCGWRTVAGCFVCVTAATVVLFHTNSNVLQAGSLLGTTRLWIGLQLAFWALGGGCVLVVVTKECLFRRDAAAWLLGLWFVGTLFFTAGINWIVNARSVLPMIPAAAILIVRALERSARPDWRWQRAWVSTALGGGIVMGLLVARGDYLFAKAMKEAAATTVMKVNEAQLKLWFEGHWGFQYYMEMSGAHAVDVKKSPLRGGDCVVLPYSHPNMHRLKPDLAEEIGQIAVRGPRWLTTMNPEVGAGFYASNGGPLPFAIGRVPAEIILVYVLREQGNAGGSPP